MRQGCVLSPDLFNLYGEHAYSGIQSDEGVELGNRWYNDLRYADDAALFADSEEGLQRIVDRLNEESERIELAINCKKISSMMISKKKECPKCRITVNGEEIVQVDSFRYLGCWVTSDGRSDAEIKCRIGHVKTAFMEMRRVLSASTISIEIRKRLTKFYVWSILTYGSEVWTMSKAMKKRLQVMKMWCWRKMLKISWTKKIKDEEVLDRVKAKKELLENIRNRQWSFLDPVLRDRGIERDIIFNKVIGKRARGRQRLRLLDNILKEKGITVEKLAEMADNRLQWRRATPGK